jgi:hypothetical protein
MGDIVRGDREFRGADADADVDAGARAGIGAGESKTKGDFQQDQQVS